MTSEHELWSTAGGSSEAVRQGQPEQVAGGQRRWRTLHGCGFKLPGFEALLLVFAAVLLGCVAVSLTRWAMASPRRG